MLLKTLDLFLVVDSKFKNRKYFSLHSLFQKSFKSFFSHLFGYYLSGHDHGGTPATLFLLTVTLLPLLLLA
jgi:hypothetical protein